MDADDEGDWQVTSRRFPDSKAHTRWLFDFLREDLAVNAKRTVGVREGAWEFITISGPIVDLKRGGGLAADRLPTMATLVDLRAAVRAGVQRLRDGDWWDLPSGTRYGIARMGSRIITGSRRGTFRTLFIQTAMDIVKEEWSRIHSCPHCNQLFMKVGKQAYCSPTCSQRARWDRFKVQRAPRDYHAERENALQKQLGPKVKVGRKTRKQRTD